MWKPATLTLIAIALLLRPDIGVAQTTTPAGPGATVRIPVAVLANGKPLPAGTYEVRVTNERAAALAGQSPDARRWVEFVAGGTVAGREAAEVLRDDDRPAIGASSEPAKDGTRVALLKGGEFLRVTLHDGAVEYLVYLPVAR
jgi:hypothetical protein